MRGSVRGYRIGSSALARSLHCTLIVNGVYLLRVSVFGGFAGGSRGGKRAALFTLLLPGNSCGVERF